VFYLNSSGFILISNSRLQNQIYFQGTMFTYYVIHSLGSTFYHYMVVFLFNTVIYVLLLLGLCILIFRLL
jgi:hypothetical protein